MGKSRSDKEEKIKVVACETDEEPRVIKADPADAFDVETTLSIARMPLCSERDVSRLEALHWMSILLSKHRSEILIFLNVAFVSKCTNVINNALKRMC